MLNIESGCHSLAQLQQLHVYTQYHTRPEGDEHVLGLIFTTFQIWLHIRERDSSPPFDLWGEEHTEFFPVDSLPSSVKDRLLGITIA